MRRSDPVAYSDGVGFRHIAVLCAVVVLLMSAVSLANLSVPLIAVSEMQPSSSQQTWFVDAFVLAFACSLLPAEMIGARAGEERVLIAGLAAFALANIVAVFAPSMAVLVASRVIAGIGAGLALPQSLSILLHRADRRRHAVLVAAWTAATSTAGIIGNGLGGFLLSAGGWRSAFAVTAPVAVVVLVLVIGVIGIRSRPDARVPLDLPGTVLFVIAASAALIALVEAPSLWEVPAALIALIVVVLVAGGLFWRRESHTRDPLLRVEVFRVAAVRAAALGIVATFVGLFTLFSLNAHLVQTVREMSTWAAGLALVPVSVTMLVITYASVGLVRRVGLGKVVAAGLLISAVGYALLVVCIDGGFVAYEVALIVIGVGAGLCSSPLSTRLTSEYSAAEGRAGSGINSTLRELASAAGVAVAGVTLAMTTGEDGEPTAVSVVAAAEPAFMLVVVMLLVCCAAMLIDTISSRRR